MYKIDYITKLDLYNKNQYAIAKEILDRYILNESEKEGLLEGIKNKEGGVSNEPLKFIVIPDGKENKYAKTLYENIAKLYEKYNTESFVEDYHYVFIGKNYYRLLYKINSVSEESGENKIYIVNFLNKNGEDDGFPYSIKINSNDIIA